MAHLQSSDVTVPTSVAAGAALRVNHLTDKGVFVFGTFVQTIQFQISPNGTEWYDEGSPVTAKAFLEITKPCMWLRANVTAHTSGQATVLLVGEERQS